MKNFSISTVFFVLIAIIIALSSCKGKSGGNTENTDSTVVADGTIDNVMEAEKIVFDSVLWAKTTNVAKNGKVSVSIKYPYIKNGHENVQDSIFAWEKELLDSRGAKTSFLELAKKRGTMLTDSLSKDLKSILDVYEEEEIKEMTYDMNVSVVYEDDEYFTLEGIIYTYLGGAHGSTVNVGQTFCKVSGKRVDWELLKGYTTKELRSEIKNGLKGYFDIPINAADSDEQLQNSLMIDEESFCNAFPLPECRPYLTNKGVCIRYQQYEIACYAAGMPECYLPVKK